MIREICVALFVVLSEPTRRILDDVTFLAIFIYEKFEVMKIQLYFTVHL